MNPQETLAQVTALMQQMGVPMTTDNLNRAMLMLAQQPQSQPGTSSVDPMSAELDRVSAGSGSMGMPMPAPNAAPPAMPVDGNTAPVPQVNREALPPPQRVQARPMLPPVQPSASVNANTAAPQANAARDEDEVRDSIPTPQGQAVGAMPMPPPPAAQAPLPQSPMNDSIGAAMLMGPNAAAKAGTTPTGLTQQLRARTAAAKQKPAQAR